MREFDFSGGVSAFLPRGFDASRATRLGAALAFSMGAAALLVPGEASAQGHQRRGPELHYQGDGYREAVRGGIQACQPGYATVNCFGQARDGSMARFDHRGRVVEVRHPNGIQVLIAPDGARTVVVPQPQRQQGHRDEYRTQPPGRAPEAAPRGYDPRPTPLKGGYHGQPGGYSLQNQFGDGNQGSVHPSEPDGLAWTRGK